MALARDDIERQESVRRWMERTPPTRPLRVRRLGLLADFCTHVDRGPDALVSEASEGGRPALNIRLKQLKEWLAERPDLTERTRHDADTDVRSFFIANGFKVLTKPYADVYHRGPAPAVRSDTGVGG